jgi:hypothetical protein
LNTTNKKTCLTKVQEKDNPNYGKHGIGAILERVYNKTKTKNSDGSITNTITDLELIKISDNIFGAEFASLYGTLENRAITTNGILLSLAAEGVTRLPVEAAWIYIGMTKVLPKAFTLLQIGKAMTSTYRCGYEAGGAIESKSVIQSTKGSDGHVFEKIKKTYTVRNRYGIIGIQDCLENREGFI